MLNIHPQLSDGMVPSSASEFDLMQLVRGVARRWPFIVIGLVGTLAAAHFLIPFFPVQYRASSQLLIYDPLRASTASLARNTSSPRELDPVSINTELEVIRSAAALTRLARALQLENVPEFADPGISARLRQLISHGRESKGSAPSVDEDQGEERLGRVTSALAKHITVERVPLSYVVTVSATASQADLAYRLVTGLLHDYIENQEELSRRSLGQSAAWVRSKVTELHSRLAGTRGEIERLRLESGVSQDGKETLVQQQRADLSAKLVAVRAEVTERRSRLDLGRASVRQGADSQDVLTSPTLSQLRVQLSFLSRQAAQLSARFGPQHAQVIAINDQESTLRRAISDEVGRLSAEEQTNLEMAQRREQALAAELDRLGKEQADTGVLSRLQELQRVADADAKLLETYSSRLEEVVAAEELGMGGKRILSPASVPGSPISPRKPLIYVGAGALGLLLGFAFAALRAHTSKCIPPTIPGQRRFGRPVIGNVPMLKKGQGWSAARAMGGIAMSYAIRSVNVRLRLHERRAAPWVVLITSAAKGEGCSTIARALATTSRRSGLATVILDCDLVPTSERLSPTVHHPGLAEALITEVDTVSLVRRDPAGGYHVLGAGGIYSSVSHPHLASERFRGVLTELRGVFDIIVIDAPPLLAIPETAAIAQCADAVLFVVDARRAEAAQVTQALSMLGERANQLTNIVLNKQPLAELRRAGLIPSVHEAEMYVREDRGAFSGLKRQNKKTKATVAVERSS